MVKPNLLPITRVLSVTTEPGRPVDMDWVQLDDTDSFVIIPRIITPKIILPRLPQNYHPRIITPESSSRPMSGRCRVLPL
jgi:hypothetical protein